MMFVRHVQRPALALLAIGLAAPPPLWAQSGRPLAAQTSTAVEALERRARLSVHDVLLEHALTRLHERSGVPVSFSPNFLPRIAVSCECDTVTVSRALDQLLRDSGLLYREIDGHVLVHRPIPLDDGMRPRIAQPRYASLTMPKITEAAGGRRKAALSVPVVGTIIGTVTEAGTNNPVVNAQIAVDGAGRAFTDAEGRYRITNVPPGGRSMSVTSIGYRRVTREVEVADGSTVTLDFALELSPSQLDEVVVTVTGEQRQVELGHVVGRIRADSVVKEAPISTISELLTGRVAGVQVVQQQGTVGGLVQLQIRGRNSISLSNDPIVLIDGVRYTTTTPPVRGALIAGEFTSPLNDINPNDIESIEVVKGPSAATLYGTDAANGVIVITTKRGQPGAPRWSAYAKAAQTLIPAQRYPDSYRAYGTTAAGTVTDYCGLYRVAGGECAQDSIVVVPNPLNNPDLSIFGKQPLWETGLNVSGGADDLRYYFSAGFQDATGPVQMPPAIVQMLESNRGGRIPEEWRKPNTRNNLNLRANVTAQIGAAEVGVQAGYVRDATRSFPVSNPFTGVWAGTETSPYGSARPEEYFAGHATERTDRFIGSANAVLRFASWLTGHGTVGLDVAARNRYALTRQGDAPNRGSFVNDGIATDGRTRQTSATADLGITATARYERFSFRTAAGAQYVRSLTDALTSWGQGLPPGGSSVAQTRSKFTSQSYSETVTLGGYAEETIGVNDRLFLTGAVRVDGASTFGRNYDAAVYPKFGASWLVSQEPFFPRLSGLDELRLRYAFGVSGQQPLPEWSRPSYSVGPGWMNDIRQDAIRLTALGNPDIRPERVREHELGFDAAGLGGRIRLGVTWNRRRTTDQIASVPVAAGYGSIFTNLGLTTQHGFEAELAVSVLNTPGVSLDVTATHASHRTKLVDIGDAFENPNAVSGYAEGYSLGARFLPRISYQDTDGDGLLTRDEVQVSLDEREYAGESAPPISQTLATVLGLANRRVRVSALLERRAGFVQNNQLRTAACIQVRCLDSMDPSTPLDAQAIIIAGSTYGPSAVAYLEQGDYIRLREVSVALDLPHFLGLSGTVTLAGRNLGLWTKFNGPDPESQAMGDEAFMSDAGAIPQGRTWAVRFDLAK